MFKAIKTASTFEFICTTLHQNRFEHNSKIEIHRCHAKVNNLRNKKTLM